MAHLESLNVASNIHGVFIHLFGNDVFLGGDMNLANHGFKWGLLFKIPLGFRVPGGFGRLSSIYWKVSMEVIVTSQ